MDSESALGDRKGMGGNDKKEREREIGGSQLHFLSDRNPTLRDSLLSAVFTERA